ncbi:SSI family serine proteinase inhibitor [Actinotalea solisilvae]|uniref:SSI family serine proteinase inhibitor n=1 Tax=Actinotalea solisilvae TaxID=2072922 RepID=UPI0018F18EAB|nr:SSI family serine proteinase inhibitor [Actinotalea solisilvae]
MRTRMIPIAAAALLLGACATTSGEPGGAPSSPAGADPSPTAPPSSPTSSPTPSRATPAAVGAELTITLDETGSGTSRTLTLTCEPPGGDHPDAAAACAALALAGPTAFEAPPRDEMCTEQYGGPQVATVEGTVDGAPVSARFSRTNGCEIGRWDALAPLLGSVGGV